jgi:hypothetical protein
MLESFTKWKPDWLYELIPGIYFVAGLTAIFYFDFPLGYGTGVLLMFAAFLILIMRKQNRIVENK